VEEILPAVPQPLATTEIVASPEKLEFQVTVPVAVVPEIEPAPDGEIYHV
jgi:hypothetical protein